MSIGWSTPMATCVLCGDVSSDVRHGLIRWRDGDPFGSGPRCLDRDGCYDRCRSNGEPWPVADGRVLAAPQPAQPVATASTENREEAELDFG